MNELFRQFERESGIDVYGLGKDRAKWEAALEKFGEMIVEECIDTISDCSIEYCIRPQIVGEIREHFGVKE